MISAKVTDNLLFSSDVNTMKDFSKQVMNRFKLSKALIDERIAFNVCRIEQEGGETLR